MICKSCNFENKEGAAFCAKCGKPLTAEPTEGSASDVKPTEAAEEEPKTVVLDAGLEDAKDKEQDDSESDTTVLTSDMISQGQTGTLSTPESKDGSKSDAAQSQVGSALQGGPAPMGAPAPQGGMKPMGGPAPMGASAPQGGMKPMGGPAPAGGTKPPKAPKQKNPNAGQGAKVYIIISAILIVAMAGVGVWGFLHFKGKLDDVNAEKDALASELDASNSTYETQLIEKDEEITELESQVAEKESQIEGYEEQLQQYESTSASYAAYDNLIAFAGSAGGQGHADFFASDTVMHLTGGQVAVQVYFTTDAESSNVIYNIADSGVAVCEWGPDWAGDVATLYVTPAGSGNTVITLSNDINDETIEIYVYVD